MNIERFEAKDYSAIDIFTRENIQFSIPIYQRTYNWNFKDEIKVLLDDLIFFSKSKENSSYYLGNIILKAKKTI